VDALSMAIKLLREANRNSIATTPSSSVLVSFNTQNSLDPIEYKLIVDMPDGFRLPNPDKFEDDKTSVSAFGDKRIQLVDEKN
jgi:hypothetical protein